MARLGGSSCGSCPLLCLLEIFQNGQAGNGQAKRTGVLACPTGESGAEWETRGSGGEVSGRVYFFAPFSYTLS